MTETKFCTKCGDEKPITEFSFKNKKRGIRQTRCKTCMRAYSKRHYRANKKAYNEKARRWDKAHKKAVQQYVIEYLIEHPCVDCGETNPLVLEFDHIHGNKVAAVSELISEKNSLRKVKAEIAKCEVRCGNCHRRVTAERENWWIYQMMNDDTATASISLDEGE